MANPINQQESQFIAATVMAATAEQGKAPPTRADGNTIIEMAKVQMEIHILSIVLQAWESFGENQREIAALSKKNHDRAQTGNQRVGAQKRKVDQKISHEKAVGRKSKNQTPTALNQEVQKNWLESGLRV